MPIVFINKNIICNIMSFMIIFNLKGVLDHILFLVSPIPMLGGANEKGCI